MKKIYSLFLLPALMLVLSCKKDKRPEPALQPCQSTYTPYYSDTNPLDALVLNFDEQRRLDFITEYDDKLDYRYEGNQVLIYENDELQTRINLESGRAVSIERPEYQYVYKLQYNGEGQLSRVELYGNNNLFNTFIMSYENGNLKTMEQTAPGVTGMTNKFTYSYTADAADNGYLHAKMLTEHNFGAFIPPSLLGKASRNVLAGSTYEYELDDNADRDVTTYTYTKDGSGRINAVKGTTVYTHYFRGNVTDTRTENSDIRYTSTCN